MLQLWCQYIHTRPGNLLLVCNCDAPHGAFTLQLFTLILIKCSVIVLGKEEWIGADSGLEKKKKSQCNFEDSGDSCSLRNKLVFSHHHGDYNSKQNCPMINTLIKTDSFVPKQPCAQLGHIASARIQHSKPLVVTFTLIKFYKLYSSVGESYPATQ